MTPGARVAAAIEIIDSIAQGNPAERVLTTWARRNRFAGSGDRAAIRDHVYDVVRQWRSTAALGGKDTGRGRMIGLLRKQGVDLSEVFSGQGHAPPPLTVEEWTSGILDDRLVALDCPDWLAPALESSLGQDFTLVMEQLQTRAPVFLRVNLAKTTREATQIALAAEGIETRPACLVDTALEVTGNPRRVQNSDAYRAGLVELQDIASQEIAAMVPLRSGQKVLDYCAGGGGKSLALAARCPGAVYTAHDDDPRRMSDLPARAARAGADIAMVRSPDISGLAPFDCVVVDAPCSGSGAWRRAPQGKWTLTPQGLASLTDLQADILARTARFVASDGILAYMTCSILDAENTGQIARFSKHNRAGRWSNNTPQRLRLRVMVFLLQF